MKLVPLALALLAAPSAAQTFSGDVTEIPLSIGGTQKLFVTAGPSFVNQTFFIAGTTSGTVPGFPLAGFLVPLNPDFYFNFTVANPNTPPLTNSFGQLDGSGFALAEFTLGAGFDPSFIGTTVSHAYLVLDTATFAIIGASNAADCLLVAGPPPPTLVINEVDYTEFGTEAEEFIEILNVSLNPVPLTNLVLELVDGGTGTIYDSIALSAEPSGILFPGEYLVIADAGVSVAPGAKTLSFASTGDNIENGDPDGLRIVDVGSGATIDGVGYGGFVAGVTETSSNEIDPPTAGDASIARCPDGFDSDDNDADFGAYKVVTPGSPNICN